VFGAAVPAWREFGVVAVVASIGSWVISASIGGGLLSRFPRFARLSLIAVGRDLIPTNQACWHWRGALAAIVANA
jgi:hypothetical protein